MGSKGTLRNCKFKDVDSKCYLVYGHEGEHELFTEEEVKAILKAGKEESGGLEIGY